MYSNTSDNQTSPASNAETKLPNSTRERQNQTSSASNAVISLPATTSQQQPTTASNAETSLPATISQQQTNPESNAETSLSATTSQQQPTIASNAVTSLPATTSQQQTNPASNAETTLPATTSQQQTNSASNADTNATNNTRNKEYITQTWKLLFEQHAQLRKEIEGLRSNGITPDDDRDNRTLDNLLNDYMTQSRILVNRWDKDAALEYQRLINTVRSKIQTIREHRQRIQQLSALNMPPIIVPPIYNPLSNLHRFPPNAVPRVHVPKVPAMTLREQHLINPFGALPKLLNQKPTYHMPANHMPNQQIPANQLFGHPIPPNQMPGHPIPPNLIPGHPIPPNQIPRNQMPPVALQANPLRHVYPLSSQLFHHQRQPATEDQNKSRYFTDQQRAILQEWFNTHIDHPYITDEQLDMLCRKTGLSEEQIKKWLCNKRTRSDKTRKRKRTPENDRNGN